MRFCAELARTGCVTDACRAVGMSTTNAYRTYDRVPEFRKGWEEALATPRPILEQAAFDRAVYGVEVGVHRNGQVVATHRRYSDGLLRYLLEREEKRCERGSGGGGGRGRQAPPREWEEVQASILAKLSAVDAHQREEERRGALAFAERMRAEGKAP